MIASRLSDLDGSDTGGEENNRCPLDSRETREHHIDMEYGCFRMSTLAIPTSTTSRDPNTYGNTSIESQLVG